MKDDRCAIEVGVHPGPYWRDDLSSVVVCDRHRRQYDERDDLGPFVWQPAGLRRETVGDQE